MKAHIFHYLLNFQRTLSLTVPVVVKEHLKTAFVVFSCWMETWAEKIGVFLLENVLWDCSVTWWVIVVLPTHTEHLPLVSVMAVTLFSASCTSKKIIHHWRTPLPSFLQLDVSGDDVHDCIVRGSDTMLFMIEVRYGTILWHVHQHKSSSKCTVVLSTSWWAPLHCMTGWKIWHCHLLSACMRNSDWKAIFLGEGCPLGNWKL